MVDRNQRKGLVLGLLSRGGSVTSADLAELWNLSRSGVSTMLAKYHIQGLVTRRREPGPGPPVYRYWITPTGLNKARWLAIQGLLNPPGQERLPGLEPELFRPQLAPERFKPKLAPERFKPKLID